MFPQSPSNTQTEGYECSQPLGPSVSRACVQREWDLCLLLGSILIHYTTSAPPRRYLPLSFCSSVLCALAVFLLLKHRSCRLFMLGNNHQNTVDLQPYLHPALSCGIAVEARYEQNSQTRGIMPRNVCLVIIWLLQTGRGDVNVINLARLTQRACLGI